MRTFVTDTLFAAASIAITAGSVVAASPAAAAAAKIDDAPRTTMVRTGDLDLANPAGRAIAARRIRIAANGVCSTDDARFPVDGTCRAKAIADATIALDRRFADAR